MKNILSILFVFLSILSSSQSIVSKLPDITVDDLKVTHCSIDSSANAQILYEIGETRFLEDIQNIDYEFTKTARIQILNKDGYEHGEIKIYFYSKDAYNQETVSDFKATSYSLENGEIVQNSVRNNALITEKISDKVALKKYAFTNLKPGTIIEYTYKITSPYLMHLPPWYFQHDIPAIFSGYKISINPRVSYVLQNKGFMNFDFDTVYTRPYGTGSNSVPQVLTVYEWELSDVPAFTDDKYVTTDDDYLQSMWFQLESYNFRNGVHRKFNTTWKQMSDGLLNEIDGFGGYIKQNKSNDKRVVEQLDLSGKDEYEKIEIIVQYVKNNFRFNNRFGINADQLKNEMYVTKTGNDASINLLLLSLLNTAGIEANPLLVSTRSNGEVYYQYPMLTSFNYVVVLAKTNDGSIILDATDPYLPNDAIPYYCINDYGFEVKKMNRNEDANFYPLNPLGNKIRMQQVITINPETDSINVVIAAKFKGYNAARYRKYYADNGKTGLLDYFKEKITGEISDITIEKQEEIDKDLVIKFVIENRLEKIGSRLIIDPFIYNDYADAIFVNETRDYPVDFGNTYNEKFVVTFQIPEGYEIDFVPENVSMSDLDNSLVYKAVVIRNNNIIQILSDINITKSRYEKEDYQALKTFFDKIVEFHNQKIILKKK